MQLSSYMSVWVVCVSVLVQGVDAEHCTIERRALTLNSLSMVKVEEHNTLAKVKEHILGVRYNGVNTEIEQSEQFACSECKVLHSMVDEH